jgi:hypothetical protein
LIGDQSPVEEKEMQTRKSIAPKSITRKMILPLLAVLALGLAPLSYGQFGKPHTQHRTLGYYDSTTGAFQPLGKAADAELPPVTPTTGTITFRLTINVKSAIPKNAVIGCTGDATVFDDTSLLSAEEYGSAVATLVSGTQYLCIVKLPYSWSLSSPTSDQVSLGFTVTLDYGYEVTATNGTATFVEPVGARETSHTLAPIAVPLSGVTTTNSITVTM